MDSTIKVLNLKETAKFVSQTFENYVCSEKDFNSHQGNIILSICLLMTCI
jgi:hypothetical protein